MKWSFLPDSSRFYELLENQSHKTECAIKEFRMMIRQWDLSHSSLSRLTQLEHECDQIVHEIMLKLNKSFVTPIDREDIHSLTKRIDDVMDTIHALSQRMVLFQIQTLSEDFIAMAELLERSITLVVAAIFQIRKVRKSNNLIALCIQIHTLENEGDRLFESALQKLFLHNPDPIEVIKWKEIYDFLEKGIDMCEDIADIVWGIVVKYG